MRTILKLHRSNVADLAKPHTGAEISTFTPADADEWLALNNQIFVEHPDQGDWVMQDLTNRMAESWFDSDGFYLAREKGRARSVVKNPFGSAICCDLHYNLINW